ncbi:hypothetical protein HJC23_012299 [Cyclotella cryptica]|uniref:Protein DETOXIFICATION n=1 Tax=Cyclotella cryptica TaxID=29204 RepID=A0ABD3PL51_9STRA|eukprot:CCRYP_013481-RA/>CCRYP_013481-RA protein AED:0.00 eAED:0.00 QI:416/-1/1/1/-1/1/1/223/631
MASKTSLVTATCFVGTVEALVSNRAPLLLASPRISPRILPSHIHQSARRSLQSSRVWSSVDENLTSGTASIDVDAAFASSRTPPIDFDNVQKVEALDFIARHVQEIGSEIVFQQDTTGDSSSIDPVVHPAGKDSALNISPSNKHIESASMPRRETRQMIREILAIALPSLGGMLLDPIMSLVDTACVGQVSTTSLAAMAPCTSIFQFAFFAFFFLSAATTNLVASNPPETVFDANDTRAAVERVEFNEKVVSNAALLSVVLGTMVTWLLYKFCDPLLIIAGIPSSNTALLDAARPYMLIRALGIPFVFLATVLQGSSLGRGNAWRPLKIFGAAGIINLVGDIYLTLVKGWGATGAAVATVGAQVGAAFYYILTTSRLNKSVEESSKPKRDVALAWKGFASKEIVQTFVNVAVTLFFRSIGIMLAFSMMTRAAALGGTAALAAHQVTLQVWWLISFLPEPMTVAAQTLITRDMKDRPSRVPKLIKTLYSMSLVLGLVASVLTLVALRAPAIASALVADVSVQKMITTLVPFAVLSQGYCPLATLSDGVCIGLGSFGHLPGIMLGSFVTTFAGLTLVARYGLGVVGVWGCMNVFLSARILGHLLASTKLRLFVRKAFAAREEFPIGATNAVTA